MDEWMNGYTCEDGWMDGFMDTHMNMDDGWAGQ